MARVELLDVEDFDPSLRAGLGTQSAVELGAVRAFAHCPDIAVAHLQLTAALAVSHRLPPRLVELVRLRVAFFNQCRSCMATRFSDALADGLTEALVCSLERPEDAIDLTDAEKSAIRFAELMATDHLSIDDTTYDALRCHFDERQIIELGIRVAMFVGFGRLTATWAMLDDLPLRFQGDEPKTPWGGDVIVRHRSSG